MGREARARQAMSEADRRAAQMKVRLAAVAHRLKTAWAVWQFLALAPSGWLEPYLSATVNRHLDTKWPYLC